MPPRIADMLETREAWMDFYLNAFWDLTTCRAFGLGAGPIPWRDIDRYAARYEIEGEDYEIFKTVIRKLDQRYLEHGRTS